MTPTDNKAKLVKIYCYVCEMYEKKLKYYCQRFSNNSNPEFTDREAITIYLYSRHAICPVSLLFLLCLPFDIFV